MTPRPAPKIFGTGSILPLAAAVIACATLTLAALSSFGLFASSATAVSGESLPPTAAELRMAIDRVGITPESLTAAGVQPAEAAQVVTHARAHLDAGRFSALTSSDADWQAARREVDRLEKLVRAGQASQEDLSDLAQARADIGSATAARNALLESLRRAATADLPPEQAQSLLRIEANAAPGIEVAYRVNDRTEADWVTLREAASNLRVAQKLGEEPDYTASQLITRTDAEPEVAAARSYLDTRLPQVRSAFDQALEG